MQKPLPPNYTIRLLPLLLLLCLASALAAQRTITGQVTDSGGLEVIGANVTVTGAAGLGTITDLDGLYTLDVPADFDSLTFSYVGLAPQTVAIAGRSTIDIRLDDGALALEEIVVVGYGTVKQRDYIGAADQVTSRNLENVAVTSFDQALAGQVAGAQIRTGTGQPGSGAEILIRGVGSLTSGNEPLIVIDGVPFGNYNGQTNNLLSLINPNDIESVSVIRDAAEKAIYGSRAAAGLILITTKRGRKEAKPTISFNSYAGVQTIPDYEKPDVLNAEELATFLRQRIEDEAAFRGTEPVIPDNLQNPASYGEGTDWFDAITRSGRMYNTDISLRGGSDKARYAISLGYTKQEGVIIESGFERYTARANFDLDVTDWLTVSMNLAPSWTETRTGDTDAGAQQFAAYNILAVTRWADPSAPLTDANGDPTLTTLGSLIPFYQANPVYKLRNQYALRNNRQLLSRISGVAQLPIPGLTLNSGLAGNLVFNNNRSFGPGSVVGGNLTPLNTDPGANSFASAGRFENQRLVWETQLAYQAEFGLDKRHNLNAFAGYTTEIARSINFGINGSRVIDENFEYFNSGNIATNRPATPETPETFFSGSEQVDENSLISYLGRVRYSFDSRYFVNLAARIDGSSRFGPNNKYGAFPSVSVGWRPTREPWFPSAYWLSDLRFEVAYGLSGNNNIGDYRWQGGVGGSAYVIGNSRAIGRQLGALPNFDLGWEEAAQLDAGFDIGLFKDRVTLKALYYEQTTRGGLFNTPIPNISGFGTKIDNVGEILNRGVEVQLNSRPVVREKLVVNIGGNVSFNRTEVISLGPAENAAIRTTNAGNSAPMSWTLVGEPVAQYYGNKLLGLYTPEMLTDASVPKYPGAQVGSPFYVDGDGDGVLEFGVIDDFVKIGNPFPEFTAGLTANVSYGPFDLRVIGTGEFGFDILDLVQEIQLNTDGVFNNDRVVLDRFRPGSTDYSLRVPNTYGGAAASQRYRASSSASVKDGTYFQIANVTLTYKLNDLAARAPWLAAGSVYVSAQNALMFTKFDGNPQIQRAAANNATERNVRYGAYPVPRTFTLGFALTL